MREPLDLCNQRHELAIDFAEIQQNERRTLWVVALTLAMMVVEITAGYLTGSMALLADGYHMASHAGALGIAYVVYRLTRNQRLGNQLNFGTGKLLPLGGYTSAIGLGIVAFWMAFESFERLLHPIPIEFSEAIAVASLGLLVNLASAALLGLPGHGHHHHHDHHEDHHEHEDHEHEDHEHDHHGHHGSGQGQGRGGVHDHNHRSAVIHVLADALTSLLAIVALVIGKFFAASWLDPVMGLVGAAVILRWAYSLCKATARELLDAYPTDLNLSVVRRKIEADGHKVVDLHAWRTGPSNLVCMLTVGVHKDRPQQDFRAYFGAMAQGIHLVVERV